MKRFLCFYLSFLLSFNAYSADMPATTITGASACANASYNGISYPVYKPYGPTFKSSCNGPLVNAFNPHGTCARSATCASGAYYPTLGAAIAYTCPENSTASGSICIANAGYSTINQDGTWSVVPTQNINSLCGALQDYKASTSTCGYMESFTSGLSVALTGLGVVIGAIGLIVSAPLVAGVGGAIALLGGVSSISINGNDSDSTSPASGSQPLNVRLSSSAPASSGSTPSVVYDATENKFKPDGSGATGSWSQNGATGEWETTPDSKGTVSKISSNGQTVSTETPVSGGGKVVQTVTKKDDEFEVARTVPQTISYADGSTAQGTVTAAQSFNSSGSPTTPKTAHVMPSTSSTGSTPASSSSPSTYKPPPPSTGGTNIVAGQCGSMNCESTQISIQQALTRPADMTDMQPSDTELTVNKSSVKGLMFSDSPEGIQDFFTFELPPHNSICPTLEIPFNGETKVMNTHCTMAETQRDNLTILFNLMWTFVAFMILIGA